MKIVTWFRNTRSNLKRTWHFVQHVEDRLEQINLAEQAGQLELGRVLDEVRAELWSEMRACRTVDAASRQPRRGQPMRKLPGVRERLILDGTFGGLSVANKIVQRAQDRSKARLSAAAAQRDRESAAAMGDNVPAAVDATKPTELVITPADEVIAR